MALERIKIVLDEQEYRALAKLADRELRSLADQARWAIRSDLERRNLLPRVARFVLPDVNEPLTCNPDDFPVV